MFKLVKDFQDYQFVYFWVNHKKRISPKLPTLEHAREWFTNVHFSQYKGIERRKSRVDRRHNIRAIYADNLFAGILASAPGRRCCDKRVKVDLDYSKAKLSQLKEAEVLYYQ